MTDDKNYSLKKEGNSGRFDYIDQDGCAWDSPQQWLWGFLGGCGCGSSEYFAELTMKGLEYFATDHMERSKEHFDPYDNELHELIAHWMDSVGLLEHGSNVCGSWLDEKGKKIYEVIKSFN